MLTDKGTNTTTDMQALDTPVSTSKPNWPQVFWIDQLRELIVEYMPYDDLCTFMQLSHLHFRAGSQRLYRYSTKKQMDFLKVVCQSEARLACYRACVRTINCGAEALPQPLKVIESYLDQLPNANQLLFGREHDSSRVTRTRDKDGKFTYTFHPCYTYYYDLHKIDRYKPNDIGNENPQLESDDRTTKQLKEMGILRKNESESDGGRLKVETPRWHVAPPHRIALRVSYLRSEPFIHVTINEEAVQKFNAMLCALSEEAPIKYYEILFPIDPGTWTILNTVPLGREGNKIQRPQYLKLWEISKKVFDMLKEDPLKELRHFKAGDTCKTVITLKDVLKNISVLDGLKRLDFFQIVCLRGLKSKTFEKLVPPNDKWAHMNFEPDDIDGNDDEWREKYKTHISIGVYYHWRIEDSDLGSEIKALHNVAECLYRTIGDHDYYLGARGGVSQWEPDLRLLESEFQLKLDNLRLEDRDRG
ncbi:uncharacterized protein I206_107041 [Kwoniella pini CBS 10737]|uniref:Uncharacterized protein n=1 Tax=Kwoniella pini CBS 10737 TaxID=1296096 RepID=A0A1B9HZD4_9TREE|nr:uncharacterized protein I206_05416 [Kwoniella pini CBS 10737]OCF48636.1 hypothetical protein I206_05416 [Kwoniella pini CBS 10737]